MSTDNQPNPNPTNPTSSAPKRVPPALRYRLPTIEQVESEILSDSYLGWCTNCGDWTHDCCEPDAHKAICPDCKQRTCYGAEELVIQSLVQ